MTQELSDEIYVSEEGLLCESKTNQEVIGLDILIDEKRGTANFVYVTFLNKHEN